MDSAIEKMLAPYQCKDIEDYKNALKEIIQEIALLGLYRGGFFKKAAFYGGTALRIFYDLDRFSEDLDFSLVEPDKKFNFEFYLSFIREELAAYGFEMLVEKKFKKNLNAIKSAFIKGGTQINLLKIQSIKPPVVGVNANELLKVKLEVDIDPPPDAKYEIKYQLNPVPYFVKIFTPSSLFAGKLHAILCREWKSRVKGRDFYDYVWYLSKNIPVDVNHLTKRMIQSGHLRDGIILDENLLVKKLIERFNQVDFKQAKKDIQPFVKDARVLDLWSEEFFSKITNEKLKFC